MGAQVTLAFRWQGAFSSRDRLARALVTAGLQRSTPDVAADGSSESSWSLSLRSAELAVTCRCYDEQTETSVALDVDEAAFERVGADVGRAELVSRFVSLAASLVNDLQLRYVFFDEEAEADVDSGAYRADVLFGITLIAPDVQGVDAARQRPDVARSEIRDGVVVLYRRLDPVPHYQPNS